MQIAPFAVEQWMNDWETRCEFNLAETCVHSLTLGELLTLSGRNDDDLSTLATLRMTYGDIRGSERLRRAISALYDSQPPEQIIATHGTIGANMLVHRALVSRGDRVVAVVPTYQQHTAIPASIGAEVVPLQLTAQGGYLPDMDALRDLVTPGTRLIALTNPNNPTGALMERAMLEELADIARAAGAYVLCDEVYRGTDQQDPGTTPSIADIYERGISTCGMSKAFSLAGLRLGWVAGPADVIEAISHHRDYDTISVGRVDDHLAALALENADRLLARSRRITRENLGILSDWIATQPRLDWVMPRAATVTLLHYDMDTPSRDLCLKLLHDTGVMLTPGDCFDMEGTLRIGFANPRGALQDGLARFGSFLAVQR